MKLEFDVLDERNEFDSFGLYTLLVGAIEEKENYERIFQHPCSGSSSSIYRDSKTTTAIHVYGDEDDSAYLSVIGDENGIDEALKEIKTIIPKRIKLKKMVA